MGEGIASIGVRAFYGCTNLREIASPDSVTEIRENAFFHCWNLKEVTFGSASRLNKVGINAFYGCRTLLEIALPDSLHALPASCFAGCASLVAIDLGGVTQVGKNAFLHCNSLRLVTALPNVTFEDGNEAAKKLVYGEGE